jgi:hypothetical protein
MLATGLGPSPAQQPPGPASCKAPVCLFMCACFSFARSSLLPAPFVIVEGHDQVYARHQPGDVSTSDGLPSCKRQLRPVIHQAPIKVMWVVGRIAHQAGAFVRIQA